MSVSDSEKSMIEAITSGKIEKITTGNAQAALRLHDLEEAKKSKPAKSKDEDFQSKRMNSPKSKRTQGSFVEREFVRREGQSSDIETQQRASRGI